jgi:hypothetical protein
MRGIEFEVIWPDQDMIEYQVTCSNGPFRGTAKMYLAQDDLSKAAEILNGFPSNIKDSRDVEFGTFDPKAAGGGIFDEFPVCRFCGTCSGARQAPGRRMQRVR